MKEPLTMEQRALAAAHREFAEKLADWRRQSCLPPEDRRQEAYLGLIDAARDFDPSWGVKFETYASRRIVGAMIDAERSPGSQLLSLTRYDQRHGRKQVKVVFADSLVYENVFGESGRTTNLSAFVFVAPEPTVTLDDRDAIDAALKGLPDQEWYIANRYFLGGATMKTISEEMSVCESRVSQLVRRLVERLRDHTALSHYAKTGA